MTGGTSVNWRRSESFAYLSLDSGTQPHPDDRTGRMLIWDGLLQKTWLLQHPCVRLPIIAQRGLTRTHPCLLRILAELFGCQRTNAINQVADADDCPGATGNETDPASDGSSSTTNLPGFLSV